MGCAQRRVNPKLTCRVNRDLESLMKKTLVSVVKELPPPWKTKELGRRPHDPRTVAVCCILRIAFKHTYESIEAYLRRDQHLKRLTRMKRLPGHSVIHRGMDRLSMTYIRRVLRKIIWRLRRAGMNVAVDSTGFSITNRSMWFDIRVRRNVSRRECLKLHIAVDVDTGIIHSFTITGWKGADIGEFRTLIHQLPDLDTVMADSAYTSYDNLGLVEEKGGEPYIKFKSHHTGKKRTPRPWKNSFRKFKADPESWMVNYHRRSIVEAVFSSIKRTWGSTLRSRKYWNQRRELALKVLAYDVRQVLYNDRARKLGVDLRTKAD
ncbi:MAG: IS5 family transposase [Candidatus Thermoplasmatota archaeon]|nr:IS5 family transposase [Candidatus Thermoplasmatota archaeon]